MKNLLLMVVVALALLHTFYGTLKFGVFTPEHGWVEGIVLMMLAIVIAIATK